MFPEPQTGSQVSTLSKLGINSLTYSIQQIFKYFMKNTNISKKEEISVDLNLYLPVAEAPSTSVCR